MLKDITFGQFYDTESSIHKLDPRTKLILLFAVIIFIFISGGWTSLAIMTCFILDIVRLSKVPLKMYLKNVKAILPILIFTAVINLFYGATGKILFSFWIFTVTTGSLNRAVFMALRILLLIVASAALTYTTTPNDLTDAIEKIFSPLKHIGLGNVVHTLAMMMTIALRFIPTLIEETQKIMNAQKARGADLENGNLVERIKALIPILIPLLISSVRRAYELAEAMECRCYNGGEGRQRMKILKYGKNDYVAFSVTAFLCIAVILLNIFF